MDKREGLRLLARRTRLGVLATLVNAPGRLALLYGGTDKVEHGYMTYYRRHLKKDRLRRLLVFEIGVGGAPGSGLAGYAAAAPGGSLAVWRDYLPRATVVGVDLHEKDVSALGPSVAFMRADQSRADDLLAVVSKFGAPDVVIDDGSHVAEHIHTTFRTLWPCLRPGGLYVIEDLSTSYYPGHGGSPRDTSGTGVALAQSLVDCVQALDPTFSRHPDWGQREAPLHEQVASMHAYPGIVFVRKAL